MGIVLILAGIGKPLSSILFSAFLNFREDKIIYKPKAISQKIIINWNDVQSFGFKTSYVEIISNDGNKYPIRYMDMSYESVNDLKQFLVDIAAEKNIKLSNAL